MKKFNLINSVLGWITFVIALVTYTLTLEPTVSFWDCGEFISAAYRLQICHPPGAPLFLIIGRIFSLFASSPATVAFCVNMVSAVTSALCVMFTFWTITHLGRKIFMKSESDFDLMKIVGVMMSGLVGALALTWSDTFWFSAVEAEVYASSSFFTALTFWCILKWENIADEKHAERWLILIAYLVGLAIGVHLLSILVIPAIVYIYYFRKYKVTRSGFLKASAVAIGTIGILQFGIIPGLPSLMTKFDYFFTNTLSMGFNTGVYAMLVVFVVLVASILHYTHTQSMLSRNISIASLAIMAAISFVINASFGGVIIWGGIGAAYYFLVMQQKLARNIVNLIVLCFSFLVIGYSSYSMILIRSAANPPIDMNDPENPFTLLSYLNREQYGDNPLIYGQYFYAKYVDVEKGDMQYMAEGDRYVEAGEKLKRVFDAKDQTLFPRMWSDRADHVQAYRNWEKIPEGKKATFAKNIDFLFSYQLNYMYWRYFFWNFVGRQNDIQGLGDLVHGSWISGIPFIDNMRLGPQDNMPVSMQSKAHNTYFFLPLILGIIGMIWHFTRAREDASVILTLFLFTGFFIILYLNFPAHQPRERDYAYVGSYQTFMIWIGLGVLALIDWLSKRTGKALATGIASIASLGVPLLMGSQNWNDHDRSMRYTAVDFASNYLESCPKNAILFTNGDNDTYPLWYAQNVESIRTDVRVINLSLLNTDWYANYLKRQAYESAPVPFSMTPDKYAGSKREVAYFYNSPELANRFGINQSDYYPLSKIIQFICDDNDPMSKITSQSGQAFNFYPTKRFLVPVDKTQVLRAGVIPAKDQPEIVDSIRFEVGNNALMKADLITLDILASTDWTRPICFAITTGSDVYLNMQPYFQINGLVYQIVPILNTQNNEGATGRINSDILYDNLMNKFKWGGMEKDGIYLDETIIRQTNNFKNLFYRLAIKLVEEGQKEKAVKALDKCVEVMPEKNVPYNQLMIGIAQAYFAAGAKEKGADLLRRVATTFAEKRNYFQRFKGSGKSNAVNSELEEANDILGYCMQVGQNSMDTVLIGDLNRISSAQ